MYVVPEPVTVAVVAPAVPDRVTSPVAKVVVDSLKTTVKLIGLALVGSAWPAAWLIVTVGAVVSMTIASFAPREPAAPGAKRVRLASTEDAFRIVPPLSARAVVDA